MKLWIPTALSTLAAIVLAGCGHSHDHHGSAPGHGHSHGDDAQSFSGATHKEGEGIRLLPQTHRLLGIQTAEVEEQALPRVVRFTARVFATGAGGVARSATGAVRTDEAELVRAEMPVRLRSASGTEMTGRVERVLRTIPSADAEVIVALDPPPAGLEAGSFLEATVSMPGGPSVTVVPRQALVRGATGDFVYAVNGEAYLRVEVTAGAEAGGRVEIRDGLLAGDRVVTRGAMDLWLVELRAVKGGQGCCPAPPAKGKN